MLLRLQLFQARPNAKKNEKKRFAADIFQSTSTSQFQRPVSLIIKYGKFALGFMMVWNVNKDSRFSIPQQMVLVYTLRCLIFSSKVLTEPNILKPSNEEILISLVSSRD